MPGKSLMVVVIVMLLSANVMAEVPYNFSSGSVVKSSEVNANFNHVNYGNIVVKDGNGNVIGSLINLYGYNTSEDSYSFVALVFNEKGYFMDVDVKTGKIPDNGGGIWYASTDCSGNAYLREIQIPGKIFIASANIFYIPKTVTETSLTLISYQSGSCSILKNKITGEPYTITGSAYQVMPNDTAVTGISSATFALPITVERR